MDAGSRPWPPLTASAPVATKDLYKMPVLRPLEFRPLRTFGSHRRANVNAAYVQQVGEEVAAPCTFCARRCGPFTKCVVADGFLKGACANCHHGSEGSRCSFRAAPCTNSRRGRRHDDAAAKVALVRSPLVATVPANIFDDELRRCRQMTYEEVVTRCKKLWTRQEKLRTRQKTLQTRQKLEPGDQELRTRDQELQTHDRELRTSYQELRRLIFAAKTAREMKELEREEREEEMKGDLKQLEYEKRTR
ncbi:MAG: hypothetical protein M1818_007844 [Claussenomyces sp. TS43310]|nr:MAG: hypothetical protein M1818_007844 [Claussenomyces sp. TS43310]